MTKLKITFKSIFGNMRGMMHKTAT